MTAKTNEPVDHLPVPPGAVFIDEWEAGPGEGRSRYFAHAPFDLGDVVLTIHGVQYDNGRTGRSIQIRLDDSLQDGHDDLPPRYARRLAAMLQNFADTAELLDGVQR